VPERDPVDRVLAALVAGGGRVTSARRAVVEVLLESGGHVSAQELADRAHERDPSIHLATVYRTLEALERQGVVSHVHLGHSGAVFHLAEDSHYHLYCTECGAVESVPEELFLDALATIERRYGFRPTLSHFAIIGVCARCAERSGSNGTSSGGT
jgi:Fur family ferric uptake transcriptional regulator